MASHKSTLNNMIFYSGCHACRLFLLKSHPLLLEVCHTHWFRLKKEWQTKRLPVTFLSSSLSWIAEAHSSSKINVRLAEIRILLHQQELTDSIRVWFVLYFYPVDVYLLWEVLHMFMHRISEKYLQSINAELPVSHLLCWRVVKILFRK